ncbi:hypothetical protein Q8A67_005491 [Cirrhinus molitorella]|uniref:Uncharacterized protein n=1 Tax=Cirrhinus molitorella TaxID=172907 RepID=A0AA88U275_9TELE|nr:hypothetical protein Q8A67_005491 [Cirrhinus molitorella]
MPHLRKQMKERSRKLILYLLERSLPHAGWDLVALFEEPFGSKLIQGLCLGIAGGFDRLRRLEQSIDSRCKLERLSLYDCGITDVSSLTQSLTNTKVLQFLKWLDLRDNKIGYSKQRLIDVLRDSNCFLIVDRGPPPRVPRGVLFEQKMMNDLYLYMR